MKSKESELGEYDNTVDTPKNFVSFNKRWIYIISLLFVVIPILVGILVWQLVPQDKPKSQHGGSTDGFGEDRIPTTLTSSSSSAFSSTPDPHAGKPWNNYRLSADVVPSHYHITLYPNFYEDNAWFNGTEVIEAVFVRSTDVIVLHYRDIRITEVGIEDAATGQNVEIADMFTYKKYDYLVLNLASTFHSGTRFNMTFTFEGSLANKIVGFYKSTYTTLTGERKHIVSSKLEPTHAREVFPCFDEPNQKANFTITLIHERGYTALSNMPDESTVSWAENSTLLATRFAPSVIMSTYLAAFIVCDFQKLQAITPGGLLVRVWAPEESISQAQYALLIAKHVLDFLVTYLQVPDPMPKQDLVAIPNFAAGAMENWGIMTFRETNLLFDPSKASGWNKQRVATVVSHEIVHNWFGNLVTLDWWAHLWLNEGFACYLEYFGIDDRHPDWKMMTQFMSMDMQRVMASDAADSSHPIVVPVESSNEFNEVFDSITYAKGAAVLRMMHHFIGDEKFKEGLKIYLDAKSWGNAVTDDVWQAYSQLEGLSGIKQIMDTWTLQMGFPYVDVRFTSSNNGTRVVAEQSRFKLATGENNNTPPASPFDFTWYIPLDYISSSDQGVGQRIWMNRTDITFHLSVDISDSDQWLKFNPNQMGYYRVKYPDEIWSRFATLLEANVNILSTSDRANLLDDVFNLAQAGHVTYSVAFDLTKYMHKEETYLPWFTFIRNTAYLRKQFEDHPDYWLLRDYIISKGKPVASSLGWDTLVSYMDSLTRSRIIYLMCGFHESECLSEAKRRFRLWMDENISPQPDLRSRVYGYGMQEAGTVDDWNKVWGLYIAETTPQEKLRLMYSLSQTRYTWLIYKLLNSALNESVVASQDVFTLVNYVNYNPVSRQLVWLWIRSNWQKLIDRYGVQNRYLGRLVFQLSANFNTEFQLKQVEAFFSEYPDAGAGARMREQTREKIKNNINWMKTYYGTIVAWLKNGQ